MILLILLIAWTLCGILLLLVLFYFRKTEIKITGKAIDLSKVMPIQTITQGVIINGNGDLTIGYKLFLPEVFTLSEEEARQIHERLEGLLKMLPFGTIIHQQNFYTAETYKNKEFVTNPLLAENLQSYDGKEILNCSSNLYITFTHTQGKGIRHQPTHTSLLRKLNYPFTQPYKEYPQRLEKIEPSIMNFENGLASIPSFETCRMKTDELNNAVFDYMNLSYDHPTSDARKETLNPLMINEQGDMKIGSQMIAILSLTSEGETLYEQKIPNTGKSKSYGTQIELPENIKSKCSMIYPLGLGLPFNHVINVVIEITDTDTTLAAIRSEKQSLNYLTHFYPPAKEKQAEQEAFCDIITKFDYQTAYTSFNVVIQDTDKGNLMRKIALVQQGYSFMNQSACFVENAELANLFFCGIPGNARANYRGFINTTKQALCYLQKDSTYLSDLKGHVYNDRFGRPVKIDLWDYPGLNNKNRIVIGPSGSGKSFWLNNYILQSFEQGKDVVIIDIGGSYRSLIDLNNGKYFDSNERKKFAFNPFLCERDREGRYLFQDLSDAESSDDQVKTISALLSYIWKGKEAMTATEKALLEKSIKDFYKYLNTVKNITPNLLEYRKYLMERYAPRMDEYERGKFDARELALLLEPYATGELSFLLNAETNIDIVNDHLIAFDMEEASKKDYFPLIAIITLQMVIDKIKKRKGIPKELIIDEALDFLKDEKFGDFIAHLYRTFRKKEGSITLAAQNILFLKEMPPLIRDSVIINCATKIILDHSEHRSNLQEVQHILSLSDDSLRMVESLQRTEKWREFFIQLGNDSYVFRNEVSPFTAVAFDSKQATVVRVKELFKETGSTQTAIRMYLEEQQKKGS